MKPNRDASDLAARLTSAATKAPPLPAVNDSPPATAAPPPETAAPARAAKKGRPTVETVGITLRPSKAVLKRYTLAAAERTRQTGRVISAQEIMLERLDGGP